MAKHTVIDSDEAAVKLAESLNGAARVRPTAVLTIAAGQAESYVDAEQVADELSGLADVYLMPTGPHTWAFSAHMPEQTEVYGGAGRVYPVGLDWVHDVSRSPLRFAWSADDGPKATRRIIDDGLDMAAVAGLLGGAAPASRLTRRQGVVRRAENERAWVDFGAGGLDMGIVPPQLAEPNLPIERAVQPGMVVSGTLDRESKWFDIRQSRLTPDQALGSYQIGDVVVAEIGEVRPDSADARLLPSLTVKLNRADVTPDDADLRTLLTAGETVAARVLARSPWWLTLLDIDEEPLRAASVYPGGPPWLLPPVDAEPEFNQAAEPAVLSPQVQAGDAGSAKGPAPAASAASATSVPQAKPAFSPAQMPARLGAPVRAAAPSADLGEAVRQQALRDLSLQLEEVRAKVQDQEAQLSALREELKGVRYEREQLEALKTTAEQHASHLEKELKKSRSALRKATLRKGAPGQTAAAPAFADRERGFRYLVETAWARRIPVSEQLARPLPDYLIGKQFLDSVETLQGVAVGKVADVVVELLTGIAGSLSGRDMHRLRTGVAGDAPARQRPSDDAVCWRIALQASAPSARRLHAWRLSDGCWELSSIRKHDDFEP